VFEAGDKSMLDKLRAGSAAQVSKLGPAKSTDLDLKPAVLDIAPFKNRGPVRLRPGFTSERDTTLFSHFSLASLRRMYTLLSLDQWFVPSHL
jgi:hypothetical protein